MNNKSIIYLLFKKNNILNQIMCKKNLTVQLFLNTHF